MRRRTLLPQALRVAAWAVLATFLMVIILGEFIAPYDPNYQSRTTPAAPPTTVRFVDADGQFHLRPFVYRSKLVDPLERRFEDVKNERFHLSLFVSGDPYTIFGLFPSRTHLFGMEQQEGVPRVHLLGTDDLGRDRFSRLLKAMQFSLIVCPIGAFLAWLIGFAVGLISGYAGRMTDAILMGIADTVLALPTLVLILAARAAFPLELPAILAAALLIGIFAATGWAEIARLTRGIVTSLRGREFVLAARAIGLTDVRILVRHILPNAMPPIIRQGLVTLPTFLVAEVALSFLGVGLQEPDPSLGTLLSSAADINQLQRNPILVLTPAFVITAFVLAVRIVGSHKSEDLRFIS